MHVIFLGTGGYHPNERRHTASLLLPEIGVALDAGTGFFRVPSRLIRPELDIFLSHAHLDHICGLTYILVPLIRGDITRVRVFGSRETLQAVREHLFALELLPVTPDFEWIELSGVVPLAGGAVLSWIPLAHPGGSTGFRIDWPDRSLCYITDTTAPGSYIDFIRGADLLIHECYFPDTLQEWAIKTGHSAATPVAQLAAAAGVGQLALIHVDPQRCDDDPVGLEKMQSIFPRTILPDDLTELRL